MGSNVISMATNEEISPSHAPLQPIPNSSRELEVLIGTFSSLYLSRSQLSDGSLSRMARSLGYDLIFLVDLKNPDFVEVSFKKFELSASPISSLLNEISLSKNRLSRNKSQFATSAIPAPIKTEEPALKSQEPFSAPLQQYPTINKQSPVINEQSSISSKQSHAITEIHSSATNEQSPSISEQSPASSEQSPVISELSPLEQKKWLKVLDAYGFSLTKSKSFLSLITKLQDNSVTNEEKLALCRASAPLPQWRDGNNEYNYRQFYSYMANMLTLGNVVSDEVFAFLNSDYNLVYDQALQLGLLPQILDIPINSPELRAALRGK